MTESLEQIAALDVEELLSKSAVLSESMLLQLRQSLTTDWGEGFVSTLPEDFVQNLLMEVWFFRDFLCPPLFLVSVSSIGMIQTTIILFKFFSKLKNIYH